MKTYFVSINGAVVRVVAEGYDLFIGYPYFKFYEGERVIFSVKKDNVDYIWLVPLFREPEVLYKKGV